MSQPTYEGYLLDRGGAVYNALNSDFGVTGNGTTDDASALNTLFATTMSAGGTLYFPPATYRIASDLTFADTAGKALAFAPGAILKLIEDFELTINCPIVAAPAQRIFDCTDWEEPDADTKLILGPRAACPAYGAWFGMSPASSDNMQAFKVACAALPSGGHLHFTAGSYARCRSATIKEKTGITLTGDEGAVIQYSPPETLWAHIIQFEKCMDVRVEGIGFDNRGINSFGGVRFYDCERVWVTGCRFYDSAPIATPTVDRLALFVYNLDVAAPYMDSNRDIHIWNNVFDGLQIEMHNVSNVHFYDNVVRKGNITGGLLIMARNEDGRELRNIFVHHNLFEDCDHVGVLVHIEVDGHSDSTFENVHIDHNVFRLFAAESKRAIQVGAGSTAWTTSGNKWHGVSIVGNQVIVGPGVTAEELIFGSNSATVAADFQRWIVADNTIYGNGTGTGIDLRRPSNSLVTNNQVYNTTNGFSLVVLGGNMVGGNQALASGTAQTFNFNGTTGDNTFRDNRVLGSPTTRYNVIGAGTTGDYIELERLSFSATYGNSGTAIADGANYHQDTTVTNAAAGDAVSVGLSSMNIGGIEVTGNVISANTVRVTVYNHSGASRTFGAGSFRGFVTRIAP